ncbi:hypothetical protein lerEdw1_015744 [Lerista edwardsae]|nr:hypothetical protein lerEdw1_015744 [Lerista edwardsae]
MDVKVRAHQLVLPPCDVVIKAVADYVRNIQDTSDLDAIAKDVFQHSQVKEKQKCMDMCLLLKYVAVLTNAEKNAHHMSSQGNVQGPGPYPYNLSEPAITLDAGGKSLSEQNNYSNIPHEGKHTPLYERSSPINPAQSGSPNHVDSTYFPASSTSSSSDNDEGSGGAVNHVSGNKLSWDKTGIQSENQARGDLGDQTKGEIKIGVSIEDEANKDLPPAALLYRPVRQQKYLVSFYYSVVSPVIVKEWAAYKGKSPQTPELVEALAFREWTCPNLKKLWLGKAVEDKNRRMRAFLACMRSDTPAMLNPTNVPTPLMVLCCVLRYMVQWPGVRILRRQELDAFLAQALSPKLYEPDQLQELKIENLDPRGIQLSALFMSGVDMALFANDACGQPIPWEHCCPWMYFDGKLFQTKLIKATREKVPLIDLCDGQAEQAAKVEKMRQSILEGLNFSRQNHPLPFPPPPAMPFYPASVYPRHFGPVPPPQGRGRGFAGVYGFGGPYGETVATGAYRAFRVAAAGGHSGAFSGNDSNRTSKFQGGVQPIPSQGGKLEIAGTVVGHWAGSRRGRGGRGPFPLQVVSVGGPTRGRPRGVISTPVIRTFGRGGRYYGRAYKNQGAIQGKPPYAASAEEVAKELKSKSEESKSSLVSSEGPLAENGVVNEEKPASQMNGNTADVRASNQSESALSNDSKMCNTNPHLNALNVDSVCHKDDALEATVLKKEE